MKVEEKTMVTGRLPSPLVKQLDKAAEKSRRSRTAEMEVRLKASFARPDRKRSAA